MYVCRSSYMSDASQHAGSLGVGANCGLDAAAEAGM